MLPNLPRPLRLALALTLVLAALKLALGAHHQLMADEAYYWVWSKNLALGYYDQPPLIAWMIRGTTLFTDAEWAVRLGAVGAGLLGSIALIGAARDKELLLLWWTAPPLLYLTLFSTSDAPLLAAWALTLAAAHKGGRWWLAAGLFGGLAVLSKYTGLAVLPLAVLAAGPRDWRTPWPWAGLGVMGLLLVPHLGWLATHGWVSLGFQLHEGLLHAHSPGLLGPLRVLGDQALVLTPLAFIAALWWLVAAARRALTTWSSADASDRAVRLAWLTAAPVLAIFVVASVFAPPEAHWPAIAWVSVGLGLSHSTGSLNKLAWVGGWLGLLLGVLLGVHSLTPLVPLAPGSDPATRLEEGEALGSFMASWACPTGSELEPGPGGLACVATRPVFTERYQEASLIRYYTGIPARTLPGCARHSQFDAMVLAPLDDRALMLRPSTSGDALCTDMEWPERSGAHELSPKDEHGRLVGSWQLYEVWR